MLDILNDKGVLCFFVQFMETKSALSFIKFWLDVESFRTVSGEKKLAKLNKPLKNKIQTLPSANSMVSSQSTNSLFDQEVSITSLGAGSDIGSRKLHRSISSDCYEGYYTTEFDCMSVSTNSYSEHNFDELEEDQKETSPDEADHSCTATEANDVLPETPEKLETSEKTAICDTENLDVRQSLTDDEKSKINDKIRQQDEDYQAQKKPQSTALADAVRIYRKYLITNSQHFIELPATILSKLSVALCGDDAGVTCSSFIYEEAQKHIYDIFERDFLYDFLDSSFYTKYTVEVLTSANLKLAEILSSESALFYFMEFLEQDTKRCYLEFWLSATNFRKQIEQSDMVDQQQVQSDALIIYEKYFSLQATNPLNLPKNVRLQVSIP